MKAYLPCLLAAVLSSTALARPPVRLAELVKAIRFAATETSAKETPELIAQLDRVRPGLTAAHAKVLDAAAQAVKQGNLRQAVTELAAMPAWPEVVASPLGAARYVTGSCHLVRTPAANVLVDCGLAQGPGADRINRRPFPFDPAELDVLVVTHAHIDHMGLVPRLVHEGFHGVILCTPTTADLMELSLHDSARLNNREGEDEHGDPAGSLCTEADVQKTVQLVQKVPYDQEWSANGLKVTFHDAGHLPGSAIAEIVAKTSAGNVKLAFGGDTGNIPNPLLRRPQPVSGAQLLFLESTYGDKEHEAGGLEERFQQFCSAITQARADGGHVLLPTFAIGRAQVLVAWLARMKYEQVLSNTVPVVLDSPMAGKTLGLLRQHPEALDPDQLRKYNDAQGRFLWMPFFKMGLRQDEQLLPGSVIIAASGMLTAGKAARYASLLASDPKNHIIFSGYAAPGTPARALMDGARQVTLGGQTVTMKAQIHQLKGSSGHADQKMLVDYLRSFSPPPAKVVLVHGEPAAGAALKARIERELHLSVDFPELGTAFVVTPAGIQN